MTVIDIANTKREYKPPEDTEKWSQYGDQWRLCVGHDCATRDELYMWINPAKDSPQSCTTLIGHVDDSPIDRVMKDVSDGEFSGDNFFLFNMYDPKEWDVKDPHNGYKMLCDWFFERHLRKIKTEGLPRAFEWEWHCFESADRTGFALARGCRTLRQHQNALKKELFLDFDLEIMKELVAASKVAGKRIWLTSCFEAMYHTHIQQKYMYKGTAEAMVFDETAMQEKYYYLPLEE